MVQIERRDPWVKIWIGDPRWDDDDGDQRPCDFALDVDDMNALVVEWLRGPMGPAGPVGMMGPPG